MTASIADLSSASGADPRWLAFKDRIAAMYGRFGETDPRTSLYAIVETRGIPDLRAALGKLDAVSFVSLWDGSDLAAHWDIAPLLVRLDLGFEETDATHQMLLRRLWRFFVGGDMVTWIWSPFALEDLAKHFRSYCEYRLSDRRGFFLHFYDNRILGHLRLAWSPDDAQQFIAPCAEIWLRERFGADVTWENPDSPILPGRRNLNCLTDEQHQRLLELSQPDKVALLLRHACGTAIDHLSERELFELVRDQLERAASYGVTGEEDVSRYVTTGVLVGARFDEYPIVQALLIRVRRGELTFGEALSEVSADVWDAIKDGKYV